VSFASKAPGIDLITRNHARRNARALIKRRRIVWPGERARYRRKIRELVDSMKSARATSISWRCRANSKQSERIRAAATAAAAAAPPPPPPRRPGPLEF
jgi:hypothetical protein